MRELILGVAIALLATVAGAQGIVIIPVDPSAGLGTERPPPPTPPAAPTASTLQRAEVRDAQARLQVLGLYTGRIDGLDGPSTRAATEAYQRRLDVPATGVLTAGLLRRLRAEVSDAAVAERQARTPPQPRAEEKSQSVQAFCFRSGLGSVSNGSDAAGGDVHCIVPQKVSNTKYRLELYRGRIGARVRMTPIDVTRAPDGTFEDVRGNTYEISSSKIRYNDRATNPRNFRTLVPSDMLTE
ncbi:MAG: peptidoglycan-binding domain-containing protein [Pseudomonadota bacterium]